MSAPTNLTDPAALHVSLDLETLGTRPGCVVLSIGLVAFRAAPFSLVDSAHIRVDIASQLAAGLTIDQSTLGWWQRQPVEKFRGVLGVVDGRDAPVHITEACRRARSFFTSALAAAGASAGPVAGVWGYGADFDQPILAALFRAADIALPWDFHANRCGRTLAALTGIKPARGDGHHDALVDATAQGKAIAEGLTVLRDGIGLLFGAAKGKAAKEAADAPPIRQPAFIPHPPGPRHAAPVTASVRPDAFLGRPPLPEPLPADDAASAVGAWVDYDPARLHLGATVRWSAAEQARVIALDSDGTATAVWLTVPNGGRITFGTGVRGALPRQILLAAARTDLADTPDTSTPEERRAALLAAR